VEIKGDTTIWTNRSVRKLAGKDDPVEVITRAARDLAMKAMDSGWTGPPFDPFWLADFLKIRIVARDDVPDARTVALPKDSLRIEINPSRSPGRVRFSLAHEIAHTLFPDCADEVRHRGRHNYLRADDWQLEALCNLGAAELLMPVGALPASLSQLCGIDDILQAQRDFAVSTETVLLRVIHNAIGPCAMFSASRAEKDGRYHIDYSVPSASWIARGWRVPRAPVVTCLADCARIGFTAKGLEKWTPLGAVRVESVGVPGYPGSNLPRVVGVLRPLDDDPAANALVKYVVGDATRPHDAYQRRIVVHIVNDQTPNWGGAGFAMAIKRRWHIAPSAFKSDVESGAFGLKLGDVHLAPVDGNTQVASLVAQRGYGPSPRPRIRYSALLKALRTLAEIARSSKASVHMPRIGVGQAGGAWEVVAELITQTLGAAGVPVVVYDLPARTQAGIQLGLQS
jgi:O-acetyl-ADP-ribose deacetylase (regulator of RNase III)